MAQNQIDGIAIEIKGLTTVGLFMAAIVPAYLWIRKAGSANAILTRSAVCAAGLLASALVVGRSERD